MLYPFVDIAVMDSIRTGFARGDAQVVLDPSLQTILWANGAGAGLFGFADVTEAAGAPAQIGAIALRQISALAGFPDLSRPARVTIRLARGVNNHMVAFDVETLRLPDGDSGLLLAARQTLAQTPEPVELAKLALHGLVSDGDAAAMLDADGRTIAATPEFGALGLELPVLRTLLADLARERDRLIKRRIAGTARSYPAAVARLADEPALNLILVVDDRSDEPETDTLPAPDLADASFAPSLLDTPLLDHAGDLPRDVTARRSAQDQQELAPRRPAPVRPDQPPARADDELSRPDQAPQLNRRAGDPGHAAQTTSRFVWRTDAHGRFSAISDEFGQAVGKAAADLIGRRFSDVAAVFGIDPDREIEGLLERRDTWSGRTVWWPIAGSAQRVPVDLAALPTYDRNRDFEGFRGFGVVRSADAQPDHERIGLSLIPNPRPADASDNAVDADQPEPVVDDHDDLADMTDDFADDPFHGEVPALDISPSHPIYSDHKVVQLAGRRNAAPERYLSPTERQAFQEIGARLRDRGQSPAAPNPPPQNDQPEQKGDKPDDEHRFAQAELGWVENDAASDLEAQDDDSAALLQRFSEEELAWVQNDDEPDAIAEREEVEDLKKLDGVGAAAPDDIDGEAAPLGLIGSQDAEVTEPDAVENEFADIANANDDVTEPEDAAQQEPISGESRAQETDRAEDDQDEPAGEAATITPFPVIPVVRRAAPDTTILDKLPVPVLLHSGDELFYANPEFLRLTGYGSLDELAAAGGLDELFVETYEAQTPPDSAQSLRLRTRSGEEFPADALLRTAPWGGRRALMLVVKQTGETISPPPAVEEMRQRLSEMRAIVDTATDGVVLIDRQGLIRSISQPAEALFGLESDDLRGKSVVTLFAAESQDIVSTYLADLSRNGVASVLNDGREVMGREARGGAIPLFMTMGRLPGDSGFCAVLRDITQWKRAEEDLVRARADAERASTQKSEFLARVSHEIRTPLNAIIGFSELMIDEKFGPINNDRYRDYLRDISRSGNHVLDLVNDLLDLTKIEAGQQDYAEEPVALNDALTEAVAMMQPQANRERVIIRSSFAPRLPDIKADPRSIRQIALNILSNAVRYTQAGGQVVISTVHAPNGDIMLRVRDTGVGMNQSELERAMKPFQQINALNRPRGDGTGLGLPLTKAMVEANQARFMISSASGEGTLVEIIFPAARVLT